MPTTARLVTVEEFSRLPDPPGGRHELCRGKVILKFSRPRYHSDLEDNICDALKRRCSTHSRIRVEFTCRPLPEYEVLVVDVGMTTIERWKATRARDWLAGAPEVAIEVFSPSNTKREMQDRRQTLFQGGYQQFWIVDFDARTVAVSTPDGATTTYAAADSIPLEPYANEPLPLSEIFAGIA